MREPSSLPLSRIIGLAGLLVLVQPTLRTTWAGEAGAADAGKTRKLVAVLNSDASTFDKARACQKLADVGTADAVPALSALLADPQLSNYARCGLERIPDPSADAALREALGRLKGNLLIGVVNSIGARRDDEAVEALKKLACDPASGTAPEALLALGRIATPDALDTLRRMLADGPTELRPAAAEGCLLCAEKQTLDGKSQEAVALYDALRSADIPQPLRRAATRGAILCRGPAGQTLLLEQLRSDDRDARQLALGLLHELPGADAVKTVTAELDKAGPELRTLLVSILAERSDAASLGTIERLAADNAAEIRRIALKALGRVGGPSSVPVLLKALESAKEDADRTVVLSSLGQIDAPEVDVSILKALPTATPENRARLVGVLGRRRSAGNAAAGLVKLAADADPTISRAALTALSSQARPEDLPQLIQLATTCPQDTVRDAAERCVAATCSKIPHVTQRADPVIGALKKTDDTAARCALLRILGMIGDFKAFGVIAPALNDRDEKVRDAALRSLVNWPDATPTSSLLRFARENTDPVQRTLALRGIVRLAGAAAAECTYPSSQAIDWLTQANGLVKDNADEKKLILSGLANLKCVEGLLLIQPYLGDAAVADESALAAIQIARQMPDSPRRSMAKTLLERIIETTRNPAVRSQAQKVAGGIAGDKAPLQAPKPGEGEGDPSKLTFRPLFDGKTFSGWNGETFKAFRIEDGAVVGGSLKAPLAQNEFLCTDRAFADFVLRLECKLSGCNAGIQLRSRRVPASSEVCGYQADMDTSGRYWGCLYDESRRGMLSQADTKKVMEVVKRDDWNRYEIRCRGPRIQLFVNGLQTVDYTEKDEAVLLHGLIGLQIHSGNPSEVRYRNIEIAELP